MSDVVPVTVDHAVRIYGTLMTQAAGVGNDHALACMIASPQAGGRVGVHCRCMTALMCRNFPELVVHNVKDMRWKRFLYRELCKTEGICTCRAPSCGVCADYRTCFGPEA